MYRAHELLAVLNRDEPTYRACMAAQHFDLGDLLEVEDLARLGRREFFRAPAPLCLFQVTHVDDLHFFLVRDDGERLLVNRFGKLRADGFTWAAEQLTAELTPTTIRVFDDYACTKRACDEAELLDFPPFGPRSSMQWTLLWSTILTASFEVFSCSNVVAAENKPPRFINAKRVAKGKVPFFTYRTLHITGEGTSSAKAGGTHASPRLHFRRGHIRRLGDKRIWVNACMVGDKTLGLAKHDYRVAVR